MNPRPAVDIAPHSPRQPAITLYTYAMSPYAWKVHSFLLYKGLSFQCFYVNPLRRRTQLPVGIQVPVLRIGTECRADSTPIGLWLDERFPEHPRLLPPVAAERERVLEIDRWVSRRLIPGVFRAIPGDGVTLTRIRNGWRLGAIMNATAHGGLPLPLRALWPLILGSLGFLRRARAMTDHWLPIDRANQVLYEELLTHLDGGPFLGGRSAPSMADLAAYPQLLMPARARMHGAGAYTRYPELVEWVERVEAALAPSPPVLPAVVCDGEAAAQAAT